MRLRLSRTRALPGSVLGSVLGIVLGALSVSGLMAPAAGAHDLLVDISPAPSAIVTEGNFEAKLSFNNPLLVVGGESNAELATRLSGSDQWTNHEVKITDRVLTARVILSQPGQYELRWKVVSSDGHSISGESTFALDIEAPTEPAVDEEPALIAPSPTGAQDSGGGSMVGFYIGLAMVILGVIFAPIGLVIRRRARRSAA